MVCKVSICIPAYKQVHYLRKTLVSILKQTFTDYEIIITDDSPDDSVKNLGNEFDFGGRMFYYKNNQALGSPANWNEGIKKAKGEYIKIMHHDDYFTEEFSLFEFVHLLDKNPHVDFAFSSSVIVDAMDANRIVANYPAPDFLNAISNKPENLFLMNRVGAPSATIFRKNALLFDEKLKWLVDLEFYIRLLNTNKNFVYSLRPLVATVNNAEHQVTTESLNNAQVELYENIYVFNKLLAHHSNNLVLINYFALLFSRFGIRSKSDLKNYLTNDLFEIDFLTNPLLYKYVSSSKLERLLLPSKPQFL